MVLTHGAVGWPAVCVFGVFMSYSLTIWARPTDRNRLVHYAEMGCGMPIQDTTMQLPA